MPIYRHQGKIYDIPEDKTTGFEKRYPDATIEYTADGKLYDIPLSKRTGFLNKYPNAKLNAEIEHDAEADTEQPIDKDEALSRMDFTTHANDTTVEEAPRDATAIAKPIKPLTEPEGVDDLDMSTGAQIKREKMKLAEMKKEANMNKNWFERLADNTPVGFGPEIPMAIYRGVKDIFFADDDEDRDESALRSRIRTQEGVISELENQYAKEHDQDNIIGDTFRFFRHTAGSLGQWAEDFVSNLGMEGLFDAGRVAKIAERKKDGEAITDQEQQALNDYIALDIIKQEADYGKAGKYGDMFGHSLGFGAELLMTGGTSLAKAGSRKLGTEAAEKYVKEMAEEKAQQLGIDYAESSLKTLAEKGAWRTVAEHGVKGAKEAYSALGWGGALGMTTRKALGVGGEIMVKAPLHTATFGLGSTGEDVIKSKLGALTVNENGELVYAQDKEWDEAAWEGIADHVIESGSEMVGGSIPGISSVVGAFTPRKITGMILRNPGKVAEISQKASKALGAIGVHGIPEEVAEEYIGQGARSLFNLDAAYGYDEQGNKVNNFDNPEWHKEIWESMALTVGLMQSATHGGVWAVNKVHNRHNLKKAEALARGSFTDEAWTEVRKTIDNTEAGDMMDVLTTYRQDKNLNAEQKKAIYSYAGRLLEYRGFNLGNVAKSRSERKDKTDDQRDAMLYDHGYETNDAQDIVNINAMYQETHRVAEQYLTNGEDNLRQQIGEARANGETEKADVLEDYHTAKTVYEGLNQRYADAIDIQTSLARKNIDKMTHKQSGNLYPITVKDGSEEGKSAYVVEGTIVPTENGGVDLVLSSESVVVWDTKENKLKQISAKDVVSVSDPVDANMEKELVTFNIEQQMAAEAQKAKYGIRPVQVGDIYNNGEEDLVVADVSEDGNVLLTDSKGANIMLSELDVQYMQSQAAMKAAQAHLAEHYKGREERRKNAAQSQGGGAKYGDHVQVDGQDVVIVDEPSDGYVVQYADGTTKMVVKDAITVPSSQPINEQPAEEQPINEQTAEEQPTALSRVPKDKKGKPIYEDADNETAWDALLESSGNDASLAQEVADDMVNDKKKALEKLEKETFKLKGSTPEEKIASKQNRLAEIEAAKKSLAAWEAIAKTQASRLEKQQQAEAERLAAEQAQAEAQAQAVTGEGRDGVATHEEVNGDAVGETDGTNAAEEQAPLAAEQEKVNGVPDVIDDTPEQARTRGYRRVSGHVVERQNPVQGVQGKETSTKFANNVMPNGRVMVIDANELQPSHRGGQRNNSFFIDEAQPKARVDQASVLAAEKIAERMRPEEITSTVTAYTGAPVVNARGEVIQGNSRSDALRTMWEKYPESSAQYKQYLIDHASEYGLDENAVAEMERPVLVNMVDVDDAKAIELGQYVAQDTESGGVERIKASNTSTKIGKDMNVFAEMLLQSTDEELSLSELLDRNGADVIKWLARNGHINQTQEVSAYDRNGNLTPEAKNDLRDIMYQSIFQGASPQVADMFNVMPAKAQRAILATAHRDHASEKDKKMIGELQNSIRAYYALSSFDAFANAKNEAEVRAAVETWKRQYSFDDATGESYLPSDNFSNFAIELATRYKSDKQTTLQSIFNRMYDLIQGTPKADLFVDEESLDKTPRTLSQAIKEVLNIDYNYGNDGDLLLAGSDSRSQVGEQGSPGNVGSRERTENREGPTDGGTGIEGDSRDGHLNNEVATASQLAEQEGAGTEEESAEESADDVRVPTHDVEDLGNGESRITSRNSRGEVTNVSVERDGKIVSVDSYQNGALFERTEYGADGNATKVTRYGKNGEAIGVQHYEGGRLASQEAADAEGRDDVAADETINGAVDMRTMRPVMTDSEFDALMKEGSRDDVNAYLGEVEDALRVGEGAPLDGANAVRADYRAAVEQYGKDNIPADVMNGLEARMQSFEDLKRALFDRKYALEDRLRALESQEQSAQNAQAKAEKEAKKQTAFGGFLAGKTALSASNAEKALNKKYKFDGEVMSVAELVERHANDGTLELSTSEVNKYNGASRSAWNRMSEAEQKADEERVKNGGTKTVYMVNGYDLGKTAYEYAQHLIKKGERRKQEGEKSLAGVVEGKIYKNNLAGGNAVAVVRGKSDGKVLVAYASDVEDAQNGLFMGEQVVSDSDMAQMLERGEFAELKQETVGQSVNERIAQAEGETNVAPTDGQKEAGNYKKGHVRVAGYDISIEQPKGSVRSGVDANGKEWEQTMHNTYGYIRGTEGVDGDHIDVFLANAMDAWNGEQVFVVDQYNEDGSFDEHKVMLGFNSIEDAQSAYLSNYEDGWADKHRIVVTGTNAADFKKWVDSSHRKTKAFADYKNVKKNEGQSGTDNSGRDGVAAGETKEQGKAKVEDVGEVIAGARKDALKVIASAFENATVQSLIELPFAKAFKKPDLKKAVESGALREEDAAFYEAWFSTMVNTAKPKLSSRVRESHVRSWAEDVYKSLQVLKEFVEADVATRDRIVADMMANKFPTEAEELAKIEQRKEWNKGSNVTWGDKTTPNRLWVAHEVLKRLGYKAGDKIDIPYGILQANATGTGYDFYNNKGQRLVMNAVPTVEEGIERIVYLTKLKRGDTDVKHPVSSFTFVPTKTDYAESGRYRVVYGSAYNPSTKEFDSLSEAEAFAKNRKDAFVSPIKEVSRQYAYKVKFVHPLTGEKMFADEKEFDTRSEAEQYLQEQYDAVNEHVNDELAKERGEKRALSADDVVEVVAAYRGGKIEYVVSVHRKYANNMGMPLPLRAFATRADAVKYASEIKEDVFKAVQQSIEDRKSFAFFATGEDTRIGEDYRQGKDVTAEEFMDAFGFRGVQFGNWTNQRDRQMAVNQAYDALHDLAKLLGVSPKALSLNGELGIAFGSRGSGNANAHYELDEVVINLTKTRGAGSLAHEWWHALDNYFARKAEVPHGMVTDSRKLAMRDELRMAFNALLEQVDKSKYLQRSKARGDYWGRMHEVTARLLAEWVDQSLKAKGEVNTFLSRGADVEKYKEMNYKLYKRATEVAGETPMPYEEFAELDAALDGMPYPTAEEVSEFGAALRRIFDVMQERETEDGKVALFNIADEALMAERGSEAFARATERTIDALNAAGVEVVEATDAMVEEVLGSEFVEMQTIQVANERFNHELDDFSKKQHKGLLHLGRPMSVLTAAGVNARELTLSPTILHQHLKKHNLTVEDIKGLAGAIQSPILVYKHGETHPNLVVVTELDVHGGKLSIAIRLNENGDVVEISNVSSVHSKDATKEIERLSLLDSDKLKDYLRWVEKEKVSDWLGLPYEEERQDANPKLVDVAKVLQDFENPKISPDFHRVYPDRVEFLRTADGVVYGWAVGGKIYLTKEGMNPNTPAHEYTHLWAHMIEKVDPTLWGRIVDGLRGCATWNDVLNDKAYEGIWGDDSRMASEVLSRLTGAENYRREMARAQREIDDAKGVFDKAEKVSVWENVKQALRLFLDKVKSLLGIKENETAKSRKETDSSVSESDVPAWMEFVDWVLGDLSIGVNPTEVLSRKGRDARSVETIKDEFGLNPPAFSEIIDAREGLERYKSILDEDIYKDAIEDYETGAAGVAFPLEGITFVFKENCYDELEEQVTWWHEQTHIASYHVAIPNKSYLANQALEWLKDNAPEKHKRVLSFYKESEWGEEGIAAFIEELIYRYGTSKFLKADFAELKELATLADIIRNTIQYGTEDTNRRIKGGYRFGQPTSKPIPEFDRSRESEGVQGGRPIGKSKEELGSVRGDATHGADYRRYSGDATQGDEHRRNHREATQGDREVSQGELNDDILYRTSDEIDAQYPNWLDGTTTESGKHSTQVEGTRKTYNKVGTWIEEHLGKDVEILDASSGMGYGTADLRERGFNIEDVEPYQSAERKANNPATYSSYADIAKKYDFIISNAVLNVIPDNWRANVLHDMAARLKVGGQMFINTRKAGEEKSIKDKIELDSPQEVLVKRNGKIASYQRFFTPQELKAWVEQELGEGYKVEIANKANSGTSGLAAVVVTKTSDVGVATPSQLTGEGERVETDYREGDPLVSDGYTDSEISWAQDFYGKVLGKPYRSKREQKAFAERERKRMVGHVRELAESLHLDNVEVLTDLNELPEGKKRQAKGFYEKSTGKITIVIPNHLSASDAVQTLLHEAVAHYGLRQLFGARFDAFLDNVFNNASVEVRQSIVELSKKYGWDFRTATEEYLASLAEDTDFENINASWWNKIKRFFMKMLAEVGVDLGITLTDNELRYILWRSYMHLKGERPSVFDVAEDVTKQYSLKVGNYAPVGMPELDYEAQHQSVLQSARDLYHSYNGKKRDESEEEPLYRMRDHEIERTLAREAYERRIKSGLYQSQEALQDSMLSLKVAMEEIIPGTYIEDIAGFENAYLGENRLSSVNKAEINYVTRTLFKPMLQEVSKIAKTDAERIALINYMFAKHGLERNEYMRQEAIEAALNENNEYRAERAKHRDFAGLTALTGEKDVTKAETKARTLVAVYEREHKNTSELWQKVNAVNAAILRKSYESGMMTKETYDKITGMYQYYIPLRGFEETTGEDTYAYITMDRGESASPIRKAYGRDSKADDPFANMQAMMESAVMQGNRNKLVKQRFLRFARNHPSDLVSVGELWLFYNASENEWVAQYPAINENDSAEDVSRKIQEFEERMKELAEKHSDLYVKSNDRPDIPFRIVNKSNKTQHQVVVKENGKTYVVTVNGNPRLAQALNGLTNPDNDLSGAIGQILRAGEWVNRQLSANFTTRNPEFLLSNYLRDMVYANSMVWVKEGSKYAQEFNKNYLACNPAMMLHLYRKYESGTLDLNNETERLFHDFILNGGETGYTTLRDAEAHKSDVHKKLRQYAANNKTGEAMVAISDYLDLCNRAVENNARFAAFMTSRKMGRSIDRSIYDAKEISVNFNKKGSGAKFLNAKGQTGLGDVAAFLSGTGRAGYVFWNAAIQGTTNFGRQVKRHPAKGTAMILSMFALGAVIAGACAVFGDDEKDSYFNIPEYIRRTHVVLPIGDQWVSIPLPIEYRAVYGMGELMSSVLSGKEKYSDAELAEKIVAQMSQILPLDFMEGGGGLKAFVPSAVKPVVEAMNNESWTGLPIYKDTPFNQNDPEWTKAYSNTSTILVSFTKWLNEQSGGDKYTKGDIDLNPAQIEYILKGVFSGHYNFLNKAYKTAETFIFGNREYDPRNILFGSRVLRKSDERTEYRAMLNKFYKYKDEYDDTKRRLTRYIRDTEYGVEDFSAKINEIYNSPEYERYELFEQYSSLLNELQRDYNEAKAIGEEEYMEVLNDWLHDLQSDVVKEIEALEEQT